MPLRLARKNLVLSSLSKEDLAVLESELLRWPLATNDILFDVGDALDKVVFPTAGVVSLVAVRPASQVEVAMVGREGFIGMTLVAGTAHSPYRCVVRAAGEAVCIPASRFNKMVEAASTFRDALRVYFGEMSAQLGDSVIAASTGTIPQRLARWILMTLDRADGDTVTMTHHLASERLGVRRPSVTAGLQSLERQGLIRTERSLVTVVDRRGLTTLAGDIYTAPPWKSG
ncbi:MAG: Crp/Fnr family transcriptional regulator [Bauldia sp.]